MRTQVCGLIMLYNGVNVKKWSHFILGVFNYYVVKHTYVGPTYVYIVRHNVPVVFIAAIRGGLGYMFGGLVGFNSLGLTNAPAHFVAFFPITPKGS